MSTMRDRPHLVWERTHAAPQASIWHVMDFGVGGHKRTRIIAMYELTAEEAKMPIAALERIYPCPQETKDTPEIIKLGDAA